MLLSQREIDVRRTRGATVIAFCGEADYQSVEPLRVALREAVDAADGPVIVDLRRTRFIDSSGISTLLNALRRLTRQGRTMAVVADRDHIVRPLQITRLDSTLNLRRSLADALDAV